MKFIHRSELERYHQIPKDFVGPEAADDLFSIYDKLRLAEHSSTYLYTAGSAAAEAGLMANDAPRDVRHARLHDADTIWQKAQESFINAHINDDWSEAKLLSIPDRIEMNRIFISLYHDFVDGCVREATIEKTHERLVRLGMLNTRRYEIAKDSNDSGGVSMRRGLGYKLGTLMTITRLKCPSFFAIPATARADHGAYHPSETHDVRLVHQSWGTILSCVPYEVKPCEGQHRERYSSALVAGRVLLLMPSSTDALDLALYMDKEQRNTLTPHLLQELNEITSRVLSEAVGYKNTLHIGRTALVGAQ